MPSPRRLVDGEWSLQITWRVEYRPQDPGGKSASIGEPAKPLIPCARARIMGFVARSSCSRATFCCDRGNQQVSGYSRRKILLAGSGSVRESGCYKNGARRLNMKFLQLIANRGDDPI